MHTFFLVLYVSILPDKNPFIKYLSTVLSFTKENSFCQRYVWSLLGNRDARPSSCTDIMMYQMVYKYVQWYEKEKYKKLRVNTPPFKKFILFADVFDNRFLTVEQKNTVCIHFGKCVKHYLSFVRLAHIWKYKRAKMVVERDLYWNDLDVNKSNVYVLYQNGARFTFVISELMKVMHNSLCEDWEDDFAVTPKKPYNPYNKVVFAPHELYNLYFYMRFQTHVVIPLFFHLWFLEEFDFRLFRTNQTRLLRKMCIKHFINTSTCKELFVYQDIIDMLYSNEYTRCWKIHAEFPRDKLLGCMRPYLYLYYLMNYDLLDCDGVLFVAADLSDKLMDCYHLNPDFGQLVLTSKNPKSSPFTPTGFSYTEIPLDTSTTIFGNTESATPLLVGSNERRAPRRSRMRQNNQTAVGRDRRRTRAPSRPRPISSRMQLSTNSSTIRNTIIEDVPEDMENTVAHSFNTDFLPIHARIY